MKKIIFLSAVLILMTAFVFAAGQVASGAGLPASATNPVTLKWVGFGFEANNTAKNLLDRYKTRSPYVTIDYQELGALADTDGMARLDTLIAGGQQIDICYLNTSQLMNRAINGAALPLDDAIKANGDDFIKDYGMLGAQATAYGGNIYGVPRAGNTFKVFYNKTMADRYGINIPDQMTQAEFLDVTKKFQAVPGLRWPACLQALWVHNLRRRIGSRMADGAEGQPRQRNCQLRRFAFPGLHKILSRFRAGRKTRAHSSRLRGGKPEQARFICASGMRPDP